MIKEFFMISLRFLPLVFVLLLVQSTKAAAPNFILILADDYGWTSLSTSMDQSKPAAKSDYYETPNLDSLVN
ncbi:MAG: hypothetical protein ACPH15_01165, partial [Pseudomonadales bacterium]